MYTCRILVCRPPVAESAFKSMMAPGDNRTIAHCPPSSSGSCSFAVTWLFFYLFKCTLHLVQTADTIAGDNVPKLHIKEIVCYFCSPIKTFQIHLTRQGAQRPFPQRTLPNSEFIPGTDTPATPLASVHHAPNPCPVQVHPTYPSALILTDIYLLALLSFGNFKAFFLFDSKSVVLQLKRKKS